MQSNVDPVWSSLEHRFDPEHPTAAGHFPGTPIIPGALLLDQVLRAIAAQISSTMPQEIRHAKFLYPVRPGDRVTLCWRRLDNGEVEFEIRLEDRARPVLVGAVKGPGQ